MGSCFLVNGFRYQEAVFNRFANQSRGALKLIALSFLVILAVPDDLYGRFGGVFGPSSIIISRTMAICLLVFYMVYLFFETYSHAYAFQAGNLQAGNLQENDRLNRAYKEEDISLIAALPPISAGLLVIACLIGITFFARALISNLSEYTFHMNKAFIGFILFPFLGNLTDYISACRVAYMDELDISLFATLGSSMQILLFTLPALEILGWIIGKPMTLQCPPFEVAAVFFSVLVINNMVQTGKSNFLSGAMCISLSE